MESMYPANLHITHVEKEGPFLKIWGQRDRTSYKHIERLLQASAQQLDNGVGKIPREMLEIGLFVCVKHIDGNYHRARINDTKLLPRGYVEVNFIDFGYRDICSVENVRSFTSFPSSFISITPLANGYILAEAHCPGGAEWNPTNFEIIAKELKYREVQYNLLLNVAHYYLVKLYLNGTDLGALLIQRGLMTPIHLQTQQAVILSMSLQRQHSSQIIPQMTTLPPPPQRSSSPSLDFKTYKACHLEPGQVYPVYVSYISDGPCLFYVQLQKSENCLIELMSEINSMNLKHIDEVPIPGTACLAKCAEDGNICRAVVTNEVDNQFKVFYVDFGNYEVVPVDCLYQIPFKFVIPKVMAIRFSLFGVEKSTLTMEMQRAFKKFVDDRLLHMKVLPSNLKLAVPKCELWDITSNVSALTVVQYAAKRAYPEPIVLNRGFKQNVKVSYVYSCSRFYVQLSSKEEDLKKLMMNLQQMCMNADVMEEEVKIGLPCCALYEPDGQWYRAEIVDIGGGNVKVRYIDYGNEEVVNVQFLREIDSEMLTILRPQALECSLNGYQNMEDDKSRDDILSDILLENSFQMRVVDMLEKKAIVELFDDLNYNVASILLNKLAAANSQVSPVLVQAGNKLEHRKSSFQSGSSGSQRERKPRRERRDYSDSENSDGKKENSWRQEGNERNFRSKFQKEDKDRSNWNQNNKGFRSTKSPVKSWNNHQSNHGDNWGEGNENSEQKSQSPTSNKNSWNNNEGFKAPYKKRDKFDNDRREWKPREYQKKNHDDSTSSEKSFKSKGPRTSSRNDRTDNKFQKKPQNNSYSTDSWSISPVGASTINAAPADAKFKQLEVVGTESNVYVTWFHNPGHFFTQIVDNKDQLKVLMDDIQIFYKGKPSDNTIAKNASIITLFPDDNVLYRATLLENLGSKFKVFYVDFGNVSTVNKIWPIDKKFMELPAQAIPCGLNGVAPVSEQWPNADCFDEYFNKEQFLCKFVNKDETRTYVNLSHDGEDISSKLIEANLAKATEITTEVEIPILLGQQFKVTIKSVNNLSDIIAVLDCGLAINCAIHNLYFATETYEETLRGLIETIVIVYVDNVIDDKLEVTLYDMQGTKINIITPDEGSYETVEPLCPALVLSSNIKGYVSHVADQTIYLQTNENVEKCGELLDEMYNFYNDKIEECTIVPKEEEIYTVLSTDTNWYRGRVVSLKDESVRVNYVDYGNDEEVEFKALRTLMDQFKNVPVQCVQITINEDSSLYLNQEVALKIHWGENGWEGVIQPSTHTISTLTTALVESVNPELTTIVAEDAPEETEIPLEKTEILPEETQAPPEELETAQVQVFLSHVDSPNEFYLQLQESLGDIEALQETIQTCVQDMPVLENKSTGMLCAAPYSGDQEWYRAEILDFDDDITTVRFIDFGNTDVIDNKTTQIKTLPSNLLSTSIYATKCSLLVKPKDDLEWGLSAFEMMETLTDNVYADILHQDEKINYVELYLNNEKFSDSLINAGLATRCDLPETKLTGFVSHLNSPSEFFIQLESCIDELEFIAECLSNAENFEELTDLTAGTLCAALFPDDQMWYRARILSNTIAGIELVFVDYGNSCTGTKLRQLPEDLVIIPPLAMKCCLQRPDDVKNWSAKACEKFQEISADGQTIFTVKKLATGEKNVVQLLIENVDVSGMLNEENGEETCGKSEVVESEETEKEKNLEEETVIIQQENFENVKILEQKETENGELQKDVEGEGNEICKEKQTENEEFEEDNVQSKNMQEIVVKEHENVEKPESFEEEKVENKELPEKGSQQENVKEAESFEDKNVVDKEMSEENNRQERSENLEEKVENKELPEESSRQENIQESQLTVAKDQENLKMELEASETSPEKKSKVSPVKEPKSPEKIPETVKESEENKGLQENIEGSQLAATKDEENLKIDPEPSETSPKKKSEVSPVKELKSPEKMQETVKESEEISEKTSLQENIEGNQLAVAKDKENLKMEPEASVTSPEKKSEASPVKEPKSPEKMQEIVKESEEISAKKEEREENVKISNVEVEVKPDDAQCLEASDEKVKETESQTTKALSSPTSVDLEEKNVSRPETPTTHSRPHSRLSFDEKIPSAIVSRPHSPINQED